jgi:hypothetical protein
VRQVPRDLPDLLEPRVQQEPRDPQDRLEPRVQQEPRDPQELRAHRDALESRWVILRLPAKLRSHSGREP